MAISKEKAASLAGKRVYAHKRDGTVVSGKLVRVQGNRIYLQQSAGKKVKTKAILPLALFDLLAIGTSPYVYGLYPYGGYPYGHGYGYGYGYHPGIFF